MIQPDGLDGCGDYIFIPRDHKENLYGCFCSGFEVHIHFDIFCIPSFSFYVSDSCATKPVGFFFSVFHVISCLVLFLDSRSFGW